MGQTQSIYDKHGYTVRSDTQDGCVATSKEGEEVVIKKIKVSSSAYQEIASETDTLENTSHPHIVGYGKSFEEEDCLHVVMDHCKGGNLALKIQEQRESGGGFKEEQILQWTVQTCMALKCIHEKGLLHKDLTPQRILLTEFGTICLGGFGKLSESERLDAETTPSQNAALSYISPETLQDGIYDAKSDIWSMGCVLYELCTLKKAFTAETTVTLIPKVLGGTYPTLPGHFSPELHQLLNDIFQKKSEFRPTASEILGRAFIISFLMRKSKTTVEELQANLEKLKTLADGLEKVHQGTTIGSLTGGVIGAAGGITSIVGLILAPFTLGASLIVTGVGVGVAVAGGATAGVSNITNMVNESCDRLAIKSIIKEFSEKMKSVVTSLELINQGLEELKDEEEVPDSEGGPEMSKKLVRISTGAGRGLGGIAEMVRLVQVGSLGKVAAQTARVVRVAEVATGVLSALFIAVDVFFIAMDAKEIYHIRQVQALEAGRLTNMPANRLEIMENDSTAALLASSDPDGENIKSETMKFVWSIRQTAENLQDIVDQLTEVTSLF